MLSTKSSYSLFLYSSRVDEDNIVTGNGGTGRSLLFVSRCCGCSDGGGSGGGSAHVSNGRQFILVTMTILYGDSFHVCTAKFIASRCRLSSRWRRPTVLAPAYLGGSAYRRINATFSERVSRGGDRDGLVLHTRRTRRRLRRRRRQLRTTSVPEHKRPTLSRPCFESDERVNNKNGMINISAPIGARGGYVTRAPRPPGRKTNNLLVVEPNDTINGKFLSNFSSDRDVISAQSI